MQRTSDWKALDSVVTRHRHFFFAVFISILLVKIQHFSFFNISRALRAHFDLSFNGLSVDHPKYSQDYFSQVMLLMLFSQLWHNETFSAMAMLATYPPSSLKRSKVFLSEHIQDIDLSTISSLSF